ncbi:hypothetical protein [Arthrobacter sp. PsM3]|uniref:hypothetical protein n=1 Tax=Arthrobacter sp. PsM3 TaxID=3030531 RepID=UPI00263B7347|nr:hypothetical protein [Arthrobacter sp. PsM3]MDN4645216.1 hypothetical protein [Arthrobacter sp. PsM3]
MAIALAPQTAAGKWAAVFAVAAVLNVAVLSALPNPVFYPQRLGDGTGLELGGAFLTWAGVSAVLGLVGLLHYRERSALNWVITLFGGAAVIWLAVQQLALTATPL